MKSDQILIATMKVFISLILLWFSFSLNGQVNPPLIALYRNDVIPRVDILIPSDTLAWIYETDNLESNYPFHATFAFDDGEIQDTLHNIGFRLRGNFTRQAAKKSFKISFNTYEPGRKYFGVEKLNLNGLQNDPSASRAKFCADVARQLGLPAIRSNHVQLFINGNFYGVYLNVEQIDEEFVQKRYGNKSGNLYKCLYPADLNYKGNDPDLYKEEFWGRRAYELKTNELADDYEDLAQFVNILNNTSITNLPCELEKVFNVDRYLKNLVFDILTGNWDGYAHNMNNYYLYHNISTNRFEYIPYDLDNSFGIDWIDVDWGEKNIYNWNDEDEYRPLYSRLLEVPAYKDRFSFYMSQTMETTFNETSLYDNIEFTKSSITPFIEVDPFYPMDYGFTFLDFQNAFDQTLPFPQTDYGVKPYISKRIETANNQLQLNPIAPIITQINNNHPHQNQAIEISAFVEDDSAVDLVEFCYYFTEPSDLICIEMKDDGATIDTLADDHIYSAISTGIGFSTTINYFIRATDNQNNESVAPTCDYYQIYVSNDEMTLSINELLASNNNINTDEFGEYDDWIEIHNYGKQPIYLGDKFLSDNDSIPNKWNMPDVVIQPNEYLLFWADNDDEQGDFHTNFKLKSSGEQVGIYNNAITNFQLIDFIEYDDQTTDISFGRIPNGIGEWQLLTPTPGFSNISSSNNYVENNYDLLVFPNPTEGVFHVDFYTIKEADISIEVIDLIGKNHWSYQTNSKIINESINLKEHPCGIYFLTIKVNGRFISFEKIVLQ